MARVAGEPAVKRAKLDFSDSESDSGVQLPESKGSGFTINEGYAKRFEHNKKREEKHRLEEKYGSASLGKRKFDEEEEESEEDSEDDVSEDDDAALATEDVDQEIFATLEAIKKKDPRVYDSNVKFYKEFDPETAMAGAQKKDKPMYLQDYQRERLLSGHTGGEDEEDEHVPTYQEEQDMLKRQLVGEMHQSMAGADYAEDDDEDDMLVAKKKSRHEDIPDLPQQKNKKKKKQITDDDIKDADKDPETYLSNFMLARAWLPGDGARFDPLESDDSEDDKRADEFENAYNLRFEDPATANETLKSFSRDVGKYGVRRDEKSSRQKAREREAEARDAAKREREEDKARLRKLKIEEAEEKVRRIKEAAGLRGKELNIDDWRDVIEGDFEDDKWDEVLNKRFGDDYYAEDEALDSDEAEGTKKQKFKKPKWDDDIDIDDLVPNFEKTAKPEVSLSDLEDDEKQEEAAGAPTLADTLVENNSEAEDASDSKKKKKKIKEEREKARLEARRAGRIRKQIEELVDANLAVDDPTLTSAAASRAPVVGFRYRETSPTNFGLTSRDILFAEDSQLNQWAGIKKLHAFRDEERKRKDKKKLSKKARLKQWRKQTFGKPDEPTGGFERILGGASGANAVDVAGGDESNVKEGSRKRRRKGKKNKVEA